MGPALPKQGPSEDYPYKGKIEGSLPQVQGGVERESVTLRMRFSDGTFSQHDSVPYRVVVDHERVRSYLDDQLAKAGESIGLDPAKTKLMPYVLVLGEGPEQVCLPLGLNKSYFDHTRSVLERYDPQDEMGTMTPGYAGAAYFRALREYDLAGCGVIVGGKPEGIVFAKLCGCCGDMGLNISREHYGPYTSETASVHAGGDSRDCYEGRGPLNSETKKIIGEAESKTVVTLGPPDDIVGIMNGQYYFQRGAWLAKR
jgi:hypothetical protein